MYTIGIDLGGTQLRGAIMDQTGELLFERKEATEADKGPKHVINNMKQMIRELQAIKPVIGIGIGSPGPLHNGVIHSPPNLPGWDNIPLAELIQQEFQLPVYVDNDANVAALAEACLGAGRGVETIFYVTVSTGIGGGYVINREVIRGAMSCTGEVGNMIIASNGPVAHGLNIGSWESLASGTAIGHRGEEELQIDSGAKGVFQLAKEGNPIAQKIVQESLHYLAIGLANIITMVNPHKIILGGGVMQSVGQDLPLLAKEVDTLVYPQLKGTTELALSTLGKDVGVIGAGLLTGILPVS